jgi:murein DD-endopeptidase MepM/ murein hydrolase activator NlpD
VNDGFLVKIIPPAGATVYRLRFRRRDAAGIALLVLVTLGGLVAIHLHQIGAAASDLSRLQAQRIEEQRKLDAMERLAQALQRQNNESERTLESIRRALGGEKTHTAKTLKVHASLEHEGASVALLAARLQRLQRASAETRAQASRLSRLAARVLNLRRVATIARQRLIAAIPSLNPVNGGINAAFGYRTDPFPEFHKGLDLAADYGTTVHAAAAGTVASAGWDGEFGIRIDIDHGNGYHTWYCHLSRVAVTAGERVGKGQPIAAVGSTGESTGPHLHYQVMREGVAIDPLPFLNGVPPKILATLRANSGVQ